MSAITCPSCFVRIPRGRVAFRCAGEAVRGCEPRTDDRLSAHTGADVSLPPVFAAARPRGRRAAARAVCPECGHDTTRRVCPECHGSLPGAYCETPGRIIVVVGARNSGKSTYTAVVLHELSHRVGAELGASLVACDDRTIQRYRNDFERPLFDQRRLLSATPGAATAPPDPLVYLLTRTRRGRLRRREATMTLVLFDTAGEDLRSREATDAHLRCLKAADAVVFLVDPLDTDGAGTDGGSLDIMARVTESLRAGHDVPPGVPLAVPLALVLTKIDSLDLAETSPLRRTRTGVMDLDDHEAVHEQVRALLHERRAGDLERYIGHRYATHGLFGVSALGGAPRDGRVGAGGVRPHRVEDPLLWLLHRFGMIDRR